MTVTIYTDASPTSDGKTAFAYIAYSEYGKIEESGISKRDVENNNHAEVYAIARGVAHVSSVWPHTTQVIVKTDSQVAISNLMLDRPNSNALGRLANSLKAYARDRSIRLDPRHVKGHQPKIGGGKDGSVNRKCDRLCKTQRLLHESRISSGIAA